MQRRDIVWVDLDPDPGNEANKLRPAIIVSNDGANRSAETLGRGVGTVAPVTRATERVYPFQVLLPAKTCGLARKSKAQAEQVRSVAVQRIGTVVGQLPPSLIAALDDALRLHLSL